MSEWIPAAERQPNEYGQYLVTALWKGKHITDLDDYFSYGWDDYQDNVIAWMPLPRPYMEEGKDDE